MCSYQFGIDSADVETGKRTQVWKHVIYLLTPRKCEPLQKQFQMLMFVAFLDIGAARRIVSGSSVIQPQENIVWIFTDGLRHRVKSKPLA